MLALLLAVINLSNADPAPLAVPPTHIGDKAAGLDLQTPLVSGSQTLGIAAACAGADPRINVRSFDTSNVLRPAAASCPNTDDGLFTNNPFAIVPDSLRSMLVPEFSRYVPGAQFGSVAAPRFTPIVPAAPRANFSSTFSHEMHVPAFASSMMAVPHAAGGGRHH